MKYAVNPVVDASEAMSLQKRADCSKPAEDAHRLVRVVANANIVVTARDGNRLVGLARGLKEESGCCYLSDLLVDRDYQNQGIGAQLIREVRKHLGENSLIVLVPSPDAVAYSTEIG